VLCGPWRCRGAEDALGVVRLACSNTLSVRLCWLGPASPRRTFWSLLGGEGSRLEGLTQGPGSPQASGGRRELVFLCHGPRVTLSGERSAKPRPRCSVGEPPSLDDSGRVFLCPGLCWRRRPVRSRGPGSGFRRSGGEPPSLEQRRRHAQARTGFLV
jgi:hypothetical protein